MGTQTSENFRVDLKGMVDLLSQHLYSSPRVYLRELLQNAVDAIAARAEAEPGCPRRVDVTPADVSPDGRLHMLDTGVGLDEAGIADVLATIGRSSKRDDLGVAREGFIGQFGIGLLSCFLVTDEVEMRTRLASGAEAVTVRWRGRADGTYDVSPADEPLAEPGTEVVLAPSPEATELLDEDAVRHLIDRFGAYLPCEIVLHGREGPEHVGGQVFPWDDARPAGVERRAANVELAERRLGLQPLDAIPLEDLESGLRGLAFVTPEALVRATHRAYVHQMLLSDSCDNLLPEWAFFVRAIVDSSGLRPTASREALFEDELLEGTRERLGEVIRGWLTRTLTADPAVAEAFLDVHRLAVKAMAGQDDAMLDVVGRLLTFETTVGDVTLDELRRTEPLLRYVTSVTDFQQVAPIATAQGLSVVNAGYAYDLRIIARYARRHPELETQRLLPTDLMAHLEDPDPGDARRFAPLVAAAQEVLRRAGCEPQLRSFTPAHLHALLLTDRDTRLERERQVVEADSDEIWAGLLATQTRSDRRPSFVLNSRSQTLRRLADAGDPDLQAVAVEALYAHALVAGRHRLRPVDSAIVARALPRLIDTLLERETRHGD